MKYLSIFPLVFFLALVGCSSKGENQFGFVANLINSENENAGVKAVVDFYGGYCEFTKGKSIATGESAKTYFELTISQSEFMENYKENPRFPASNIAYKFFNHLNEEEKSKYTHINPIIVFSDGSKYEVEVPVWELEIVENRMVLMDKVVNILREKRYDDLLPMLNDSTVVEYNKEEVIENIKEVEPELGDVLEEGFRMYGYRIDALDNNGNDYLYYSGVIMRSNQNNGFSLVVDANSEDDEVLFVKYEM